MLQRPWLAWFFSNVAAVTSLLVGSACLWPSESSNLLHGASAGVLQGAALAGATWLGALWARTGSARVRSGAYAPVCLVLAVASGMAAFFTTSAPGLPTAVALAGLCVLAALGQASMLVALVHAPSRDDAPLAWDLGPAMAMQMWAAVGAAGLVGLGTHAAWPPDYLLASAAIMWAMAAGLFAWMQKTALAASAMRSATVSMASLLRHRRWPLLGVAAICGGLAACTPTLWVQSLHCLSGLQGSDDTTPILMLLGYGIGAKIAASVAQRPATVRLALAITLLGCAAFFLLGMIHFNTMPQRLHTLELFGTDHPWRRGTLEVLLTAMVVLPMSVSTGACLPLVAGAVGNGAPASAHTMLRVLRAYGLGMLGGAALVPLLAQVVGLEATMRAAALFYAFAALVSSSAATSQRKVVGGLDFAALALALAIAAWPRWTVPDVQWQQFRGAQALHDVNGLHYEPRFDNMRPHAPKSALLEDQSSS